MVGATGEITVLHRLSDRFGLRWGGRAGWAYSTGGDGDGDWFELEEGGVPLVWLGAGVVFW